MSRARLPAITLLCSLACVLAALAPPAWAQYKWKDARGQVHLSDLPPPPEVPDRDVLQRPAPRRATAATAAPASAAAAATATIGPAPVDPELEARRQRAERDERARVASADQRLAEQRATNCQRARSQLAMLDSGQRIARINAQGERVIVDDATRAAEAQQARRVVDSDCR